LTLPKSCKTKNCFDSQYGCTRLYDCEIYQDLQAEYQNEMIKDFEDEEKEETNK